MNSLRNSSRMSFSSHFRTFLFVSLWTACSGFAGPVEASTLAAPPKPDMELAAGLVPHKALYDIKMVSAHNGTQVLNIGGQMFYDWKPACDAWISNHRFNLAYEYADSPPMRITSDFSTYETFDGATMNFTSQRKRDGELFEEVRGQATLGTEEGASKAVYTIPEDLEYKLAQDTLFPMGHTLAVLSHIKAGEKFFKSTIFDGTDKEGPIEINAFIGKPEKYEPVAESKDLDQSLLGGAAWRIRLAFFPLNKPSETSDYEMELTFHENGIIRDMIVEYDDFTLSQKLVALEKIEGSPCEDNGAAEDKKE